MSKQAQNVTILFLIKNEQVLLAMKKRGFGEGLWNGVGGKQENNETIEQTARRECYEEIIVKPIQLKLVAKLRFIFMEDEKGVKVIHYCSVYLCNKWTGEPIETEEMRPQWFNKKELPYNKMWPDDIIWIPKIMAGEKIDGHFYFNSSNNIVKYSLGTYK